MDASTIGTEDLKNIGTNGQLKVRLPSPTAVKTVKNKISRVKKIYPRKDGMTYTYETDRKTNTITVKVVSPKEVNKKNK